MTIVIDVLEQMLPRNLLAATHYSRDALIIDQDLVLHPALATEIEHGAAIADEGDMPVAKRRQAEALVIARIFGVADADAGCIQQTHHHCQHFFARQTGQCHVALQNTPQLGQLLAKGNHAFELCAVAKFAPFRVIAVLFAPASVAAGRLQMSARLHADPHVAIGRRNRQTRDALQILLRFQAAIFRRDVAKTSAHPQTTDTRLRVRYINESGFNGHLRRFSRAATEFVAVRCRFQRHSEWLLAGSPAARLWRNADGV